MKFTDEKGTTYDISDISQLSSLINTILNHNHFNKNLMVDLVMKHSDKKLQDEMERREKLSEAMTVLGFVIDEKSKSKKDIAKELLIENLKNANEIGALSFFTSSAAKDLFDKVGFSKE